MRNRSLAFVFTLAAGLLGIAGPAFAQCHPFLTPPEIRGDVPTPAAVLGQPLGNGQQRDVTVAESDTYLRAVSLSSTRVADGTVGHSVEGRPLRYAVVGKPEHVTPDGLARVAANARRLQDPELSSATAERLARSSPAIVWIAGNVHGDEESGADSSLRTLYELAARDDCVVRRILDAAVVVVLPIQNPDGRVADRRQNAYGFDINRDWFARTQPETDAKLELMRELPPVLFIDAHEMPVPTFFFPPVADPVYHELPDAPLEWLNERYGTAMQDEFDRQGIPYFNSAFIDLFFMGYGDTVPIGGFGAAGMTFEKHNGDPAAERVQQQFVAQWTSLDVLARSKSEVLDDWHATWRQALADGRAGRLEPNRVVQPENTVQFPVPDERVRHYFLRADEPGRGPEVQTLVRRLQRMDVEVRRLTAPLQVPDFKPYGRSRRAVTLPAGSYWIPMAQRQKRWVQAMLNEDPYVPFPYFYDVSAWSLPLLLDLDEAGRSGALLEPRSRVADRVAAPQPKRTSTSLRIGVWQFSDAPPAVESAGWLRYRLEREWRVPYNDVTTAGVTAGALRGLDVLVLPHGIVDQALLDRIGDDGRAALRDWVEHGGRVVAWRGGLQLAARLGLTSTTATTPTPDPLPGSLVRANLSRRSPLAAGAGGDVWVMNVADDILQAASPGHVVAAYPARDSDDFFVSGWASEANLREVAGTAAVVDEPRRAGRFVGFASDPNFRAFADGTARLLLNALTGPDPARSRAAAVAASRARRPCRAAGGGVSPDGPEGRRCTRSAGPAPSHRRCAVADQG